jgi:G patch domain-containing protein 1
LGYSGLKPTSTTQKGHINFFKTFVTRSDKKFTIGGQAFGVGADEEEDDDIYAMDDMSNYDRTLTGEVKKEKKKAPKSFDASLLEGFAKATINDSQVRVYSVDVPRNFTPRNWLQRRSRFQPIERGKAEVIEAQNRHRKLGLGRHDLKPEERGLLINDKSEKRDEPKKKEDEPKKKEEPPKVNRADEAAKKISDLLNSKQFVSEKNQTFKPFLLNPEKQERYEKFLALKTSDEKEIDKLLNDIQPLSMSSFDREMEKKEFMQAKRMYQPLDSLMANRFIKEVDAKKENEVKKKVKKNKLCSTP